MTLFATFFITFMISRCQNVGHIRNKNVDVLFPTENMFRKISEKVIGFVPNWTFSNFPQIWEKKICFQLKISDFCRYRRFQKKCISIPIATRYFLHLICRYGISYTQNYWAGGFKNPFIFLFYKNRRLERISLCDVPRTAFTMLYLGIIFVVLYCTQ